MLECVYNTYIQRLCLHGNHHQTVPSLNTLKSPLAYAHKTNPTLQLHTRPGYAQYVACLVHAMPFSLKKTESYLADMRARAK